MEWKPRKKLAWELIREDARRYVTFSNGQCRISKDKNAYVIYVASGKYAGEEIAYFQYKREAKLFSEDLGMEIVE